MSNVHRLSFMPLLFFFNILYNQSYIFYDKSFFC